MTCSKEYCCGKDCDWDVPKPGPWYPFMVWNPYRGIGSVASFFSIVTDDYGGIAEPVEEWAYQYCVRCQIRYVGLDGPGFCKMCCLDLRSEVGA